MQKKNRIPTEKIEAIRELRSSGASLNAIAEKVGVSVVSARKYSEKTKKSTGRVSTVAFDAPKKSVVTPTTRAKIMELTLEIRTKLNALENLLVAREA